MPTLDIRTLSFLVMISSVFLALGLHFVHRVVEKDPSLRQWAMGSTAVSSGFVLIALRGLIPDAISIVLANSLIVVGSVWRYLGNRSFQQRTSEYPWCWWLTGAVVVLFVAFTYLTPNLSARIALISAVLAGLRFASAFVLLHPRGGKEKLARQFVAGAYLVSAMFLAARAVHALVIGTPNQDFMTLASAIQSGALIFEIALSVSLAIGLPLLVLGRTHRLLLDGEQRYRNLVEWSPAPLGVHDGATLFYVNQAAVAMIGAKSADEVVGRSMQNFVHPDFRQFLIDRTKSTIENAAPNDIAAVKLLRLDGTIIDVEVQSVPVSFDGKPAVQTVLTDFTERKRTEDQVRQLAFYDALTKLPNRSLFCERLEQALAHTKRGGCYGAVLFLDLDNFKPLNDTHGHEAGDQLLYQVADRLRRSVREVDTVGRFGGDEFVVLLSELNADKEASVTQARFVAEKISKSLSEPYRLSLRSDVKPAPIVEHKCSASIGATLFIGHECSQEEIFSRADAAMYQAKAAGRNMIPFHGPNG